MLSRCSSNAYASIAFSSLLAQIIRIYLLQLLLRQIQLQQQSYQPLACYLFVTQMFYCVFLCFIMTRNAVFSRLTRYNTCLIMLCNDHVCWTMFCSHVDEMWTRPSVRQVSNLLFAVFTQLCIVLFYLLLQLILLPKTKLQQRNSSF